MTHLYFCNSPLLCSRNTFGSRNPIFTNTTFLLLLSMANFFNKLFAAAALLASSQLSAQEMNIDMNQKGHAVGENLYGIFFEEINHAGDGGLYAELVKNRNFEEHVVPSGTTYRDGFAVAPHSLNYEHGNYRDWKIRWDMDSLKMDGERECHLRHHRRKPTAPRDSPCHTHPDRKPRSGAGKLRILGYAYHRQRKI